MKILVHIFCISCLLLMSIVHANSFDCDKHTSNYKINTNNHQEIGIEKEQSEKSVNLSLHNCCNHNFVEIDNTHNFYVIFQKSSYLSNDIFYFERKTIPLLEPPAFC